MVKNNIMENKLNLVEILKDCPKGMELYSPLCGDCKLYGVNDYNITIEIPNRNSLIILRRDGTYCANGEIMLFPKGKTSWVGFVPPCEFKDGDIIFTHAKCLWISIFQKKHNGAVITYVDYDKVEKTFYPCDEGAEVLCKEENVVSQRLATEEEKEELFQAIKEHGYKWNEETKTLEELIAPKFKVGDRIIPKDFKNKSRVIKAILDNEYNLYGGGEIPFGDQDNWELVPDKFDISTLIPFDSRVLVRNSKDQYWVPAFWGYRAKDGYVTTFGYCNYCIPFEVNEHLLGTKNDCSEFYKTWK